MADGLQWSIHGLAEIQKALEELPKEITRKGIRKALHAGGDPVQAALVEMAPEDTGFMKEHFGNRVRLLRQGDVGGSIFIGPEGKINYPKQMSGHRGPNAKNARTKTVSVASVVRFFQFGTEKMAPKPFMTQALLSRASAAVNAITESLKNTVESAARAVKGRK